MDVGIRSQAPCAGEAGSQGGAEVRLFADPQVRDSMCFQHTVRSTEEASITGLVPFLYNLDYIKSLDAKFPHFIQQVQYNLMRSRPIHLNSNLPSPSASRRIS